MSSSLTESGAARAVGLCLHQPRRRIPLEPFWVQFMHGVEKALSAQGMSLILRGVVDFDEEIATYRRWKEDEQVAGLIVADLVEDEPRMAELRRLGLPAVLLGGAEPEKGFAVVTTDAAPTVNAIMDHLASRGHRVVTRVTGPAKFLHTRERDVAFHTAGARLGMRTTSTISDYTANGGRAETEMLLASQDVPTAIIYDNDVMAIAGLTVLHENGLRVPEDIAIVAWDDSIHCQLTSPPLTAIARDLVTYGALAATSLLDLLAGGDAHKRAADRSVLVVRGSSDAAVIGIGARA